MDAERFFYHAALADLSRATRAFAEAIENAAEKGARVTDDLLTARTFQECSQRLARAFAVAPGMFQVFTGARKTNEAG